MKYLCDPHIIPAVVPSNFGDLKAHIARCEMFATWVHIDIDDGRFARPVNWPLEGFEGALPESPLFYEAHVMAEEPRPLGLALIAAGVERVIAHREVFTDEEEASAVLRAWRSAGAREVGLALLIGTPFSAIDPVVADCDFVHLMSIAEIGHQGEHFDERTLSRVEELHAAYPDLMVSVDGGVDESSVEMLVRAGANRLVVGHVLESSAQPALTYARIHERAMKGCVPVNSEPELANS